MEERQSFLEDMMMRTCDDENKSIVLMRER